jgi:hypothetical protein
MLPLESQDRVVYNAASRGREPHFLPVLLPQHQVCVLMRSKPCGIHGSRRRFQQVGG